MDRAALNLRLCPKIARLSGCGRRRVEQAPASFRLSSPASADAATFGQPRNRGLYHPALRRINLLQPLLGGRTLGSFGGAFCSRINLDGSDIARGVSALPQVVGIIGMVGTQMLLLASFRQTLGYHRNDQIDGRNLVMTVGSGADHRQRSAALIRHLPPPPVRILNVGAESLSARRFFACDAVRDPRTVALLPDLVLR
jgi:hypothetical protein